MSYTIGDRFWIPDDEHAWLAGTLKEFKNSVLEFQTDKGVKKFRVNDLKFKLEACGSHLDDNVENLVDLDELSEGAILYHTRNRFIKKTIYTHVGSILVAVNPFENLPIYGTRDIRRAHESSVSYPHVFVTASTAYQQLSNNQKNQSVLISGESGAGKTETTKKVLTFLANVAPDSKPRAEGEPGVETKILQSNPLLEALGNAKTLRNNNSSRFGKWMKVGFDKAFRIQGCEIVNYLLEKSRVVQQSTNERNYHIFYQLLAGSDSATKAKLFLRPSSEYHYLNQSGCTKIDGVDDAAEYRDVIEAMGTLQFPAEVTEEVFRLLSGILLLGNINFEQGETAEASKVTAAAGEAVQRCSELLGLDIAAFRYSLCEKKVQMGSRGSVINMKLSVTNAVDSRDTLAKTIYSNMFDWTIKMVNKTLKTQDEAPFSIGILDIFGFEVFELNSFEQLCINYANEKLQFHFNEVIFNEETQMYAEEGINTDKVIFEDNGECVNLIEGKPFGLLSLLEEECSLGTNASDMTYISKLDKAFGTGKPHANKFFAKNKVKPDCFSVLHFAGAVEYNVLNFLDKNRDTLSMTSRELMEQSQLSLLQTLFLEDAAASDGGAAAGAGAAGGKKGGKGGGGGGGGKSKSSKSTLGGQFRGQLIGLVTNLRTTEPHFIRCVKPNHQKVGGIFDGQLALRQLRYAGLFEAIRIRKSGYAYRATFKTFANSYQILVTGLSKKRQGGEVDDAEASRTILEQASLEGHIEREFWHVGTTRVFLKANTHRTALERLKVGRVTVFAIRIQSAARSFILRMRANAELYELRKERLRIKAEQQKRVDSAVIVQKYWRRCMVRTMMRSMQHLIDLRKVLANREISKIKDKLELIDATAGSSSRADNLLSTMFAHEVRVARVMMRLIEIQDTLVEDVQRALEVCNIPALNRLLVKSERLEMSTHPVVVQAKQELLRLHEKRRIMKDMVAFLRNEDQFTETILHIIKEAEAYNIDPDFIHKVQRVYDSAGPRLKTRNKLRLMVETVDRFGIEQGCIEVLNIRKMQPGFAESELRAARAMLRLLHFDSELDPEAESALYSDDSDDDDSSDDDDGGDDVDAGAEAGAAMLTGEERAEGSRIIEDDLLLTAGTQKNNVDDDDDDIDDDDEDDVWNTVGESEEEGGGKGESGEEGKDRGVELGSGGGADAQKVARAISFDDLGGAANTSTSEVGGNDDGERAGTRTHTHTASNASASSRQQHQQRRRHRHQHGTHLSKTLWGHRVTRQPTMPKLSKDILDVCHAIVSAPSAAAVKAEKMRLLDRAGSVQRLYEIVRYFKWSKTLCTWRYPEVQKQLKLQQRTSPSKGHGQGGKPSGLDHVEASKGGHGGGCGGGDDDIEERDFYGLEPARARSSAYIIRTLHRDFDGADSSSTGAPAASSALMQAALSNVELPTSVQQTLANLDHLNSIDLPIPLPNGEIFRKTKDRSRSSAGAGAGRSLSQLEYLGGNDPDSAEKHQQQQRSGFRKTMIGPETGGGNLGAQLPREPVGQSSVTHRDIFKRSVPRTATKQLQGVDKELHLSRLNREKLALKAEREMRLAKQAGARRAWK